MNDKIYQVVQKMIAEPKAIQSVVRKNDEFYFQFPFATFWSIKNWHDSESERTIYSLYLYPKFAGTTNTLAESNFDPTDPNSTPFISYNTREHPEPAFERSLMYLLEAVKTRFFGVDDILDNILNS
jgi:hypothetical protein